MGIVKLLFLLNLQLAKAYLQLEEPQEALEVLEKIPEETYDTAFQKAKVYLALNQPFDALEILQQLLYVNGLSHYDKEQLFTEISLAFVKLQEPKRAVYFADLADNEKCDFDLERGVTGCTKNAHPQEEITKPAAPLATQRTPFNQAIHLQTNALEWTASLPFLNSYTQPATQAIDAQAKVQSVKESFVQLLIEREKMGFNCDTDRFEQVTSAFQRGLNLAFLAENSLHDQQLTFGEVIPLQRSAIEKFKEAKEAYKTLPEPSPQETNPHQETQDYKDLQNMMEDEKNASKKAIPNETNRVIW